MFVHPAEVVALRKDLNVKVEILDLRDERDWNLFHLVGARRVDREALLRGETVRPLLEQPASTVIFLVGNGEAQALEAWKGLKALGVGNLYAVEGGINRWLDLYPVPACVARRVDAPGRREAMEYRFAYAAGDRLPSSAPDLTAPALFRSPCEVSEAEGHAGHGNAHGITWPNHAYARRVKLKAKSAVKGGCG
jgi:rhodanese-related sulfurtransferase